MASPGAAEDGLALSPGASSLLFERVFLNPQGCSEISQNRGLVPTGLAPLSVLPSGSWLNGFLVGRKQDSMCQPWSGALCREAEEGSLLAQACKQPPCPAPMGL